MQRVIKSAIVPYSPEQMFALVDAFDTYPEFVPHCQKATVINRTDTEVVGELTIAKGPISQRFTTRNRLQCPESITLSLVKGPFKDLKGSWRFEAVNSAASNEPSCKITLQLEFDFAYFLLKKAFGPIFASLANQMVNAFSQRAKKIYG